MTADPNSVAIVGAGIVGMSAALYLRRIEPVRHPDVDFEGAF